MARPSLTRLAAAFRHAFAVDAGPFAPTDRERDLIDRYVAEIDRRGLRTAAVVALESVLPLGRLGGPALRFLEPVLTAVTDADGYRVVTEMLERPGAVGYVIERLEDSV